MQANDNMVTYTTDILQEGIRFYRTLYTSQTNNIEAINTYVTDTIVDYKLTNNETNSCEGLFTVNECKYAVFSIQNNKCPGMYGLSPEFYKHFWNKIGQMVTDSLNSGSTNSNLSPTQKLGVISLIFKKGDPTNIENWKPITILNTDYKIAAKVLANRLKQVIHKLVSTDQQCYIKDRYTGFNIREIQDIIDYFGHTKKYGALIFLDFRKAFDTVGWPFLISVLRHSGFKNSFINWIETLCNNCKTCIINNGWRSEPFKLSRGIRQGCPISSLLFILVAEIMACRIRYSEYIIGIQVKTNDGNKNIHISQLADDTTLFLKSPTDIKPALKIIELFGKYSGILLINLRLKVYG